MTNPGKGLSMSLVSFLRAHRPALTVAVVTVVAVVALAGCSPSDGAVAKAAQNLTTGATGASSAATTTAASGGATKSGASGGAASTTKAPATTAAASGTPPDPCTLVTKADAEAAAATALQAGTPAGAAEDASCTFSGDPSGPTAQIEVHIGPGAKKYLDIDRQLGHDIVAEPGLGDEGYVEDFTVFARKGRTWVAITLVRLDDFEPYRPKLLALAKLILAKL